MITWYQLLIYIFFLMGILEQSKKKFKIITTSEKNYQYNQKEISSLNIFTRLPKEILHSIIPKKEISDYQSLLLVSKNYFNNAQEHFGLDTIEQKKIKFKRKKIKYFLKEEFTQYNQPYDINFIILLLPKIITTYENVNHDNNKNVNAYFQKHFMLHYIFHNSYLRYQSITQQSMQSIIDQLKNTLDNNNSKTESQLCYNITDIGKTSFFLYIIYQQKNYMFCNIKHEDERIWDNTKETILKNHEDSTDTTTIKSISIVYDMTSNCHRMHYMDQSLINQYINHNNFYFSKTIMSLKYCLLCITGVSTRFANDIILSQNTFPFLRSLILLSDINLKHFTNNSLFDINVKRNLPHVKKITQSDNHKDIAQGIFIEKKDIFNENNKILRKIYTIKK